MPLPLISLALWIVVVHALRVAVMGNPLYNHVASAGTNLMRQAELIVASGQPVRNEEQYLFLRRFSRLTMLGLAMFVLEMLALLYLWSARSMTWMTLGLIAKNMVALIVSLGMARSSVAENMFQSLLALPRWLILADRVSALVSAAGCLVLFLAVNGLSPW